MARAAPITRASWRLQGTSAVLLPGFLWQWRCASQEVRRDWLQASTLLLLLGSGLALALHFGLWVFSIDHTSLPHSLLFVSTPPLILAVVSLLRGQPLAQGELGGVALGVLGTLVIAVAHSAGAHSEREVTLFGDMAAFGAACAFVAYISTGSHLRGWMPLYLYMLPVTFTAALLLCVTGVLLEGLHVSPSGAVSGPLGWISAEFWAPNLYLALGPGFVGHTGLNYVVRYTAPLVLSMAITVEPLLGSAFGYLLGVSGPPGLWTCIGGILLIGATVWVNISGTDKHSKGSDEVGLAVIKSEFQEVGALEEGRRLNAGGPVLISGPLDEEQDEAELEKARLLP